MQPRSPVPLVGTANSEELRIERVHVNGDLQRVRTTT
jgi:hypothetical protein